MSSTYRCLVKKSALRGHDGFSTKGLTSQALRFLRLFPITAQHPRRVQSPLFFGECVGRKSRAPAFGTLEFETSSPLYTAYTPGVDGSNRAGTAGNIDKIL